MQSKRRTSLLDRFERTLMKGSVLSILALGIATLVVVLVASATVWYYTFTLPIVIFHFGTQFGKYCNEQSTQAS